MRTIEPFGASDGARRCRVEAARAVLAARGVEGGGEGGVGGGAGCGAGGLFGLELVGGVHEWFGDGGGVGGVWCPPLAVLIGGAWGVVEGALEGAGAGRSVVWVGRRVWAYPPSLVRRDGAGVVDGRLLEASVFVDAGSAGERAWVMEQAARCVGVGVVVGDGSGLRMCETRRLQLAARGAPVLLARPPWEIGELSAARTRWRVEPCVVEWSGDGCRQGWAVELLRCKGVRPEEMGGARRWVVRRDHGTGRVVAGLAEVFGGSSGDVGVAAGVVGGACAAG